MDYSNTDNNDLRHAGQSEVGRQTMKNDGEWITLCSINQHSHGRHDVMQWIRNKLCLRTLGGWCWGFWHQSDHPSATQTMEVQEEEMMWRKLTEEERQTWIKMKLASEMGNCEGKKDIREDDRVFNRKGRHAKCGQQGEGEGKRKKLINEIRMRELIY